MYGIVEAVKSRRMRKTWDYVEEMVGHINKDSARLALSYITPIDAADV